MARVIEIKKNLIPYSFDYESRGQNFKIKIKRFNLLEGVDEIRFDIYDEAGNIIVENYKAVYGIPLFFQFMKDIQGNFNLNLPDVYFIFTSVDPVEYPINFDNLETNVFLEVVDTDG